MSILCYNFINITILRHGPAMARKGITDAMNLYHLRYFVTLAHLEHYTKAAAQLNTTQPNLSYAISSLEAELGVSLFEKDGRNIVLTKCGKDFLSEVEHSLSILDSGVL